MGGGDDGKDYGCPPHRYAWSTFFKHIQRRMHNAARCPSGTRRNVSLSNEHMRICSTCIRAITASTTEAVGM